MHEAGKGPLRVCRGRVGSRDLLATVSSAVLQEGMTDKLFSSAELAARWGCSRKKLAHDRLAGRGIEFVKIGRLCRYRLSDVIAYEAAHSRCSTSDKGDRDV